MSKDIVIVSAARTPVGSFNGAFASLTAAQLGTVALKAAIERAGIEAGMIDEVVNLHAKGVTWERFDSFGLEYRYISKYLQGSLTLEAMTDELALKSRQFAKRQLTWLKRDTSIVWLPFPVSEDEAKKHIEQFLSIRKD